MKKLHKHDQWSRYADTNSVERVEVRRFSCSRCKLTISVIPKGMLPYRSLPVIQFEAWMDVLHGVERGVTDGDPRPPPASEIEWGCLHRAIEKLRTHFPLLLNALGQQMPLLVAQDDITGFWQALRKIGRLTEILVHLAGNFNTSLLGDYRGFLPHTQRVKAPG